MSLSRRKNWSDLVPTSGYPGLAQPSDPVSNVCSRCEGVRGKEIQQKIRMNQIKYWASIPHGIPCCAAAWKAEPSGCAQQFLTLHWEALKMP